MCKRIIDEDMREVRRDALLKALQSIYEKLPTEAVYMAGSVWFSSRFEEEREAGRAFFQEKTGFINPIEQMKHKYGQLQ